MGAESLPDNRHLVIGLGIAGVLPFLISSILAITLTINQMPLIIFCYYSCAILCFIAGSLWRHQGQRTSLLVQSNAITLLAVLALISFHFDYHATLILLSAGFVWMLYVDYVSTDYARWYKQFRLMIS